MQGAENMIPRSIDKMNSSGLLRNALLPALAIAVVGVLVFGKPTRVAAQMDKGRAYGLESLDDQSAGNETTGIPTYSVFMGSEATFTFNYYIDDGKDNAVFIRQKYDERVSIYAGLTTWLSYNGQRRPTVDDNGIHRSTMREFFVMEGFEKQSPRLRFFSNTEVPISDQSEASRVTIGARWVYHSACALINGCDGGWEHFEFYSSVAGPTTLGLFFFRSQYGDGFPVELQAGFGSTNPEPYNVAHIVVDDNRKYIYNPQVGLTCTSNGQACNTGGTWEANGSQSIFPWTNSQWSQDPPLIIYVDESLGRLMPPFTNSGRWHVCMNNAPDTPCSCPYTESQNAAAAVDYADTYALVYNPCYVSLESDCTNFMSQALYAGGFEWVGPPYEWFYWNGYGPTSLSWTVTVELWSVLWARDWGDAFQLDMSQQTTPLRPGDIIFYDLDQSDWEVDNFLDHVQIVVEGHGRHIRPREWVPCVQLIPQRLPSGCGEAPLYSYNNPFGTLVDGHTSDRLHVMWDTRWTFPDTLIGQRKWSRVHASGMRIHYPAGTVCRPDRWCPQLN
jgi:hypothetical protein